MASNGFLHANCTLQLKSQVEDSFFLIEIASYSMSETDGLVTKTISIGMHNNKNDDKNICCFLEEF